jgi:hypothetical protein
MSAGRPLAGRSLPAAAAALVFAGLAALNLFFPAPNGPPDNGDFVRIHGPFSTGPADAGPRYFAAYHRFWRMDGRVTRYPEPTSSFLVFVPGLVPGVIAGRYDLALNAALIVAVLAAALFGVLRALRSPIAFGSVAAMSLMAADGNIVRYLDSFFEEAGALVFGLLLAAILHLLWERRRAAPFAAAVLLTVLLSTAKVAYAYSVPIAALPVLLGALFLRPGMARARTRLALAAVFAGTVLAPFFVVSAPKFQTANAYHFLFGAAVPELPPASRPLYLESLGIPGRFAALAGKNAYEPSNSIHDPELRPRLTRSTQAKAVKTLLLEDPAAFFRLMKRSFAAAGIEPPLARTRSPWTGWSEFRSKYLAGSRVYFVSFALLAVLAARARRSGPDGWPTFFLLLSSGFLAASALQVAVSILGNGPFDILRHDFLANLLADFSLAALVCGLVAAFPPASSRSAPTEDGIP